MKKTWDFLKNFVIIAYILLIIFVTICLLSYNNYKVTVFGKNTILPIIDEDLEPNYSVGDLLIISRNNLSTVREGDVIFFYRTVAGETIINYAPVIKAERISDTEVTYTVEGDYTFSSSYFIGKVDTATIIPNLGRILGILESKWGFLFLGVFPSLIAFLYTVHSVILELQGDDEDSKEKKTNKKKSKKASEEEKTNIENSITKSNEEKNNKNEIENDKDTTVTDNLDNKENTNTKEKDTAEVSEVKKVENGIEEKDSNHSDGSNENQISSQKTEEEEPIKNLNKENTEEPIKKIETKPKLTEEQKKALIEAKMKTMTEEQKRALIEAKLKTMTEEQKRALIEAKRKKMEADKNKD